jgi:UDP-N-acetylmuramoylalanine--D-glutamate ligase
VFSRLEGYDIVIRSPGVSPRKIITDGVVWSATNEFFARCAEREIPIIGVTGTKGKGTTSSLITSILRTAGKTVHLVGNIGTPALDILSEIQSDDIVVYELSSFQLWDLQRSPQVAVVLMIEPDHLEVHSDFTEYAQAKANIARNQTTIDRVVYNVDNEWSKQIAEASPGQLLSYPSDHTAHVRGDMIYYGNTEVCNVDNIQLPGDHNIDNTCAAITAIWPWVQDGTVIADGLRGFNGLPHRLKFVREYNGIEYYDDSIATTPGSAIAAIRAFSAPKVIILGGSDKGVSYDEIVELCKETDTRVVAIGQTGVRIAELCSEAGVECSYQNDMVSAVHKATEYASEGAVVILSPASASFGMFKNYADRGDQFIAAVQSLG